ncbi:MAG: hypothetical protein O7D32_03370, partial [bacterium]|nr:hypothetical protein [bacterium]
GAFNPDFNVNTRYVENAGANVRRPGDLPTTRNVSNNRNASLKMQFDIGRYLGKIFRTLRIIDKDDDGRATRAPPRGGDGDAPSDTTATDEPPAAVDPMFLVRATARMLSRIRKIDMSVQQRQQNSYSRIPGRPAVDYQLGLTTNTGVTLGPDKFDQPLRFTQTLGFTLDSGVQVTDNIDVAARFNRSRNKNEINSSVTFSRTQIWPDVNMNWKGLETLGPLGRLFLATNASVGYRATTRESGRGEIVDATSLSRSLTPTASFQWRNGIGSSLAFQWTNNRQETRGAESETSAISVSMDMKYTFNPGSNLRIPLPFFGSKKLKSRLDTNLNMSYARTSGKRGEVEIPGTSRVRVSPRLTYNFSRALNGSFFVDYSRLHNDATNQTITTLRVGLSAVFTF